MPSTHFYFSPAIIPSGTLAASFLRLEAASSRLDMLKQMHSEAEESGLLGDLRQLASRLGSPAPAAGNSGSLGDRRLDTLPALRIFLSDYRDRILAPLELPAILQAFNHASRNEVRELISLDLRMAHEPMLQEFAAASRGVGRRQLSRLRPLRDQRLVQRYLAAVENGQAYGWHTLVYGMTLAVYSLPVRQGLLNYAHLTTRAFVGTAAARLELTEGTEDELVDEICAAVPAAMESVLASGGISREIAQ